MKWNTEINLDKHKVFFTADLHLFHDNILWMNKRPFKDCDEMYEYFVKEWNSKVGPDDYVFVLGDVLWGSQASRLKALSEKLNGRICIVLGNLVLTLIVFTLTIEQILLDVNLRKLVLTN